MSATRLADQAAQQSPAPLPTPEPGWRRPRLTPSLAEVYRTIPVSGKSWLRKALAFAGPGYLVAVGYMDPGNWATDLAGGSAFGYTLLSVILISNLMAVLLQGLSAKLGIVSGRDLAQACRDHYSRPVNYVLWALCEIAIAACDLAELVLSRPDVGAVARGFIPSAEILRNPAMLYVAIGILGATVMPHNLYLHSSIVQTRQYDETVSGKREAVRFAFIDSTIALSFALFINAAILIVSAAAFHTTGRTEVAEIQDAYKLLTPLLGAGASTVFALALLASGQNSTLTGTLAGQIVMEGFLNLRIRPWLRRLITRLIAIVPAATVAILYGESGTAKLLILSQVILSMQLSFAVFPLVRFTSDKRKMGEFVNPRWLKGLAYLVATVIAALNAWLLVQTFRGALS